MAWERRFKPASLDDPTEYRDGRRRPFWETMEEQAAMGDSYAISALDARQVFLERRAFIVWPGRR